MYEMIYNYHTSEIKCLYIKYLFSLERAYQEGLFVFIGL